jgi:hypothetical protein
MVGVILTVTVGEAIGETVTAMVGVIIAVIQILAMVITLLHTVTIIIMAMGAIINIGTVTTTDIGMDTKMVIGMVGTIKIIIITITIITGLIILLLMQAILLLAGIRAVQIQNCTAAEILLFRVMTLISAQMEFQIIL